MVGLPYPNIYSPELKEKMTYLDATLGVRMYTYRFKPSGVPWAGRMAEGFMSQVHFQPYFLWFVSFHFRWNFRQIYTPLYTIVRHISNKPFPFLVLHSFNSEQNLFLPVATTFPNSPVFISSFSSRFFEVFELTFVPVGLCAKFLCLTTRCNLFYIILYPITNLVPVHLILIFSS